MRRWYGCPECGHDENIENWSEPPWCPYCSLESGELNLMEIREDDDLNEPTVRGEVV